MSVTTTVADVLAIAAGELGYVEGPNNQNKFGAWFGMNNVAWCCEFQSWVQYTARHARGETSPLEGIQAPKGAAYCPFVVTWARKNNIFVADPAPGRLALFDWDKDGVADHIGICTSGQDGAGNYQTIEGNTSPVDQSNGGMVMRKTRSNTQGYSLGFVDLAYSTGAPAAGPATVAVAPAPSWPGRVLALTSPLMRGQDVAGWQAQMVHRGWHLDVDGVYGPKSHDACVAFQKEKGLAVDGQVGTVTWTAAWTTAVTA